jgi:hypothetical protein
MKCVPSDRLEMDSDAIPPLSVPVPSEVDPSRNVTVPVAPEGDTIAVNVTRWFGFEGLALEVSVVVVLGGFTTCDNAVEELVA